MAAILEKLGVPRNVRLFFEPYFKVLADGSLTFSFGNDREHFGMGYHRIPSASQPWAAGDGPLLFISFSAMEAMAFLSLEAHRFPDLCQLRLVAIGNFRAGIPVFQYRKCTLLFGNDLLGRLADIKYSQLLLKKKVRLTLSDSHVDFAIGDRHGSLLSDRVSLHAFEKKAFVRSGIRTGKPNGGHLTYLDQLRSNG